MKSMICEIIILFFLELTFCLFFRNIIRYVTERFTTPCKVFFQLFSCCVLQVPCPSPQYEASDYGSEDAVLYIYILL